MESEERSRLIDEYFEAMDQTDPDEVRNSLAEEFTFISGNGTTFSGRDAIDEYIEKVRTLSDTTHEITHLAHGTDASFAEGTVSGDDPDGNDVAVGFCDVFEFDAETGTLKQVTVFINEK